jgi:hypothetical protein
MNSPLQPRYVLLFSGHMVDTPDRDPPRFPNEKSALASSAILGKLDELGANETDLGICGGACGGDLLFAERCLDRGTAVHLYLPFQEPLFLEKSVNFAGEEWTNRYYRVKQHAKTSVMPEELDPGELEGNPYARNNMRMLYKALAFGPDRMRFLALWDGKTSDGPGGTKDMIDTVKKHLGQVWILNTEQVFT